jgi:hypothetical protein
MKYNLCLFFLLSLISTAHAIEFRHSATFPIDRGQCSAVFLFDSELAKINDMAITVAIVDAYGKKIASDVLQISRFGVSSSDRYTYAFLEGEELCNDDLSIVVEQAAATIDDHHYTNLLEAQQLKVQQFEPFRIILGYHQSSTHYSTPKSLPTICIEAGLELMQQGGFNRDPSQFYCTNVNALAVALSNNQCHAKEIFPYIAENAMALINNSILAGFPDEEKQKEANRWATAAKALIENCELN